MRRGDFVKVYTMNATISILESFDLQTNGETVCRVEAGSEYSGTVRGERVKFWVSAPDKRLHNVSLPIESELIKVRAWETKA